MANGNLRIVWKWPQDLLAKLKRSATERTDAVEAKVNVSGEELEARIESNLLSTPLAGRAQFWSVTENSFFQRAQEIRDALLKDGNEQAILESWRGDMAKAARMVFRDFTQAGDFDMADPRRAALAQYELDRSMNGPFLRNLLKLP